MISLNPNPELERRKARARLALAELGRLEKFDPGQPRDPRGRWTDGIGGLPGGGRSLDKLEGDLSWIRVHEWSKPYENGLRVHRVPGSGTGEREAPYEVYRGDQKIGAYATKEETAAAIRGNGEPPMPVAEAVHLYSDTWDEVVNARLRGQDHLIPPGVDLDKADRIVRSLDAGFETQGDELRGPLYRGVDLNEHPEIKRVVDGGKFTDPAFPSTTGSFGVAYSFAQGNSNADAAILNLSYPEGTKGLKTGLIPGEAERLLPRGGTFRVTGSHEEKRYGKTYRWLDAVYEPPPRSEIRKVEPSIDKIRRVLVQSGTPQAIETLKTLNEGLEKRFNPAQPRDERGRWTDAWGAFSAPPLPWSGEEDRVQASPLFEPAPSPKDEHEIWLQESRRELLLANEIKQKCRGKDRTRLPEGTLVQKRGRNFYRVDGATGTYFRRTLDAASRVAEAEENAARARRFGPHIPGNPMTPLPGVDVPPEDPIGDKIGGMLHGGYVTLPHGTLVHRKPGDETGGEGDTFEVTSPAGTKRAFPAIDKESAVGAAREFEDAAKGHTSGAAKGDQSFTKTPAKDPNGLQVLPPDWVEQRRNLHRISEQVLGYAQEPSNEIAIVQHEGGFSTPVFGDGERVRVDGDELVRERDGEEIVREKIPHVDPRAAKALADFYDIAAELQRDMRARTHQDPKTVAARFGDPIIWPEHFDMAVELDPGGNRANFGASPGDENFPEPYFYVGPWSQVERGDLWNAQGFNGAIMTYRELLQAPNQRKKIRDFYLKRLRALEKSEGLKKDG